MDMAGTKKSTPGDERGLTSHLDNIQIDWPRSLGFFGGLGAAVALELVPLPIALFVAGVPFLKLLNRPNAPKPQRFLSHIVDGAAKPVGGDSEGTIRWSPDRGRSRARTQSPRRPSQVARRSQARGRARKSAA